MLRYPIQALAIMTFILILGCAARPARGADAAAPAASFPAFEFHVIDAIGSQLGQTALADIDHDGDLDYVCGEAYRPGNPKQTGRIWWWEYQGPDKWVRHELGPGQTDIATAQGWYENVDGKGLSWRRHMDFNLAETDTYGIAARTWVIDLDGDGDLDVVQTQADHSDGRVAWFENDGKGHFARHIIRDKGRKEDFHSLVVADLDNDGDLDIFAGAGPLSAKGKVRKSYVWENTAGAGKNPGERQWVEHVITEGRECHDPVCGDVDGDGDLDLTFKPWQDGNEYVYLRNMLMESKKH